jgi:hypothetical protein
MLLLALINRAPCQDPAGDQKEKMQDALKDQKLGYYTDPEVYDRLSGARRSVLSSVFGPKILPQPYSGAELPPLKTAAVSAMANVLVNDPNLDTTAQDTQSETAIVLGKENTIIVGYNDSGSHLNGAAHFTGYSISTDGGLKFTDKRPLPLTTDGDAGDPVLARSHKTGTIFLSTLSFTTSFKLNIFRSTNNGQTFLPPVNGAPGFTAANGFQDKEWIAVDNFPGNGFGNVYMFWRNFAAGGGMTFTKSTDDGVTWGPNKGKQIVVGGQGAQVIVNKDHSIHLFWYDQSVSPPELKTVKSTDFGNTFSAPVTVTSLKATGTNGDLGLSPGFRTNTFPQVAVNPVSGHLYIVYNDRVVSSPSIDRGDIFLRRSIDNGTSWSAPVRVNDDTTKNDQWQPALAVTPNGKFMAVAWYDRRLDPSNNLIDRFGSVVKVSGTALAIGKNFRITNVSFPPVLGVDPAVNPTYMGDYDQMTADNDFVYTVWGDNRDNSKGHAGKNANVRFAKFRIANPTNAAEEDGDEGHEIAFSAVPEETQIAVNKAIDAAPADVLTSPVEWNRVLLEGDTIAIFRLEGKDKQGRNVEMEVKGTRVIELETNKPFTDSAVPDSVAKAAKTEMPELKPATVTAIVVQGQVMSYELRGDDTHASIFGTIKRPLIRISPDGKVLDKIK